MPKTTTYIFIFGSPRQADNLGCLVFFSQSCGPIMKSCSGRGQRGRSALKMATHAGASLGALIINSINVRHLC